MRCASLVVALAAALGAQTAFAEGQETTGAHELARIDQREQMGPGLFALPIPGETFDALSGAIGHSAVDTTLENGGPLAFRLTRKHEPVPASYPFELGTMSVVVPKLTITAIVAENKRSPLSVDCGAFSASGAKVLGAIAFRHEGGASTLVNDARVSDAFRANYPTWADYIAPDNTVLACDGTTFTVHTPDGAQFEFDPAQDAVESIYAPRHRTDLVAVPGKQDRKPETTVLEYVRFTFYATRKTQADGTLDYTYEDAPIPQFGGTPELLVARPPVAKASSVNGASVNSLNFDGVPEINHKQRLKTVTLQRGTDTRTLSLQYRSHTGTCPGLLHRVGSADTREGRIDYHYDPVTGLPGYPGSDPNIAKLRPQSRCVLARVGRQDSSEWRFGYGMNAASGSADSGKPFLKAESERPGPNDYYTLPLRSVQIPTGANVAYSHRRLPSCEYQDTGFRRNQDNEDSTDTLNYEPFDYANNRSFHPRARCGGDKPAVTQRIVKGAGVDASSSQILYEQNAASAGQYEVTRRVTNGSFAYRLTYHRMNRSTNPWDRDGSLHDTYDNHPLGTRLDESGKLKKFERLSGAQASAETLLTIEYLYGRRGGEDFTKRTTSPSWAVPSDDKWDERNTNGTLRYTIPTTWALTNEHQSYAYDARLVDVRRRVSNIAGVQSESNYATRDVYGNPRDTYEHMRGSGVDVQKKVRLHHDARLPLQGPASNRLYRWMPSLLFAEQIQTNDGPYRSTLWRRDLHGRKGTVREGLDQLFYDYGGQGANNLTVDPRSITDDEQRRTSFTSYQHGIPTRTQYADGSSSTRAVDRFGNVTGETDESGISVTRIHDDAFKRLTNESVDGNVADTSVSHALWNPGQASTGRLRVSRTTIAGQSVTETQFDALGRKIRQTVTPVGGRGTVREQRFVYNRIGQLVRASDVLASVPDTADFPGTFYEYDALGRLSSKTHSSDVGTGRTSTIYCHAPVCASDSRFPANVRSLVKYGYATKDPGGHFSVYNYRVLGSFENPELVEVRQQTGPKAPAATASSDWSITTIDRALDGFVKGITQAGANGEYGVTRTYTRAISDQWSSPVSSLEVQSETHPELGTRTVQTRNRAGQPTVESRSGGNEVQYGYDTRGRLTNLWNQTPSGDVVRAPDVTYAYTPNGSLAAVGTSFVATNGRAATDWTYQYDAGGLLARETLDVDGQSLAVQYENGPHGVPVRITWPTGQSRVYTRDGHGQTTAVEGVVGSASYTPAGALASYTLANGTTFAMTTDARQRPADWTVTDPNSDAVFDLDYGYDTRGNVDEIGGYFLPGGSDLQATHDGLGRLIQAQGPFQTSWWYGYDEVGNLRKRGDGTHTMTYDYDENANRIEFVRSPTRADWNFEVTHDIGGNVNESHGAFFDFDQMNQLVRSTRDGVAQDNLYDGHGRRVRLIHGAALNSGVANTHTFSVYSSGGMRLYERDRVQDPDGTWGEIMEERFHVPFAGRIVATVGRHDDYDGDGDGIADWKGKRYGLAALAAGSEDWDGDGVPNAEEYARGSSPLNGDSDGDGVNDGQDSDYDAPLDDDPSGGGDDDDGDGGGDTGGGGGPVPTGVPGRAMSPTMLQILLSP